MAIFSKGLDTISKNDFLIILKKGDFVLYEDKIMKKVFIFIVVAIILALIIGAIAFYRNNTNPSGTTSPNTGGTKLSTNINEEAAENRIASILENQTVETEISAFSTKILDDTPGRLNVTKKLK